MKLDIYQVDAFTSRTFGGNPAAVCPLKSWLPDRVMQDIAMENNLPETAFFVEESGRFSLRWFTPRVEVDLCGHATLASAHVLFSYLGYGSEAIFFDTRSGELIVKRAALGLAMDFPVTPVEAAPLPGALSEALGVEPLECYRGMDYLLVVENEQQIRALNPDMALLKKIPTRGFIVTSEGEEVDFVSRFFAPGAGIDEDPATGSAHTALTPFWAARLGEKELVARQLSRRGGELQCGLDGDRVILTGKARTFLTGTIQIPD